MTSFADGVTIKVNGSAVAISAAEQQTDHAVIYYTIPTVQAGDTVTWEYDADVGNIRAESCGDVLEDVAAQAVTNNVAPAGDPIGDGLRDDAVAYYKMSEAAGQTRLDSTASHFDLSESADGTPPAGAPVASVAGKIGNAVQFFDDPNSVNNLANSSISIQPVDALTITCWFRFNALTGGSPFLGQDQSFDAVILLTAGSADLLRGPVAFAVEDGTIYLDIFEANNLSPGAAVQPDTWYFCVADYNYLTNVVTLYVNNAFYWSNTEGSLADQLLNGAYTIIQCGSPNYMGTHDYILVDEVGIWTRHLTSDERTYLHNSGAGRALCP
jgi:hypothetical protein